MLLGYTIVTKACACPRNSSWREVEYGHETSTYIVCVSQKNHKTTEGVGLESFTMCKTSSHGKHHSAFWNHFRYCAVTAPEVKALDCIKEAKKNFRKIKKKPQKLFILLSEKHMHTMEASKSHLICGKAAPQMHTWKTSRMMSLILNM